MSGIESCTSCDPSLAAQVSLAVTRKTLDTAKSQGEAALSLLQASLDLAKATAPVEAGKGGHVDAFA